MSSVRLYTIPDVGRMLGKSAATVYRMIHARELRAVEIKRGTKKFMRVRDDDLANYVNSLPEVA